MPRSFSVYLDAVRFLAAIIVLLSHFAYQRFSGGHFQFLRDLNLGSDAVVIFFVLSGFVISYAADQKDKTPRTYFFNRATRLLSIAIPALLLTYLLDTAGVYIAPDAYADWWYNPVSFMHFMFSGLTFSNEWTSNVVRLGTNGPYWSLSYEAAYYVLFGIVLFTKAWVRLTLLVLGAFIFGVNILILAPSWILGAVAYRYLTTTEAHRQTSKFVLLFLSVVPLLIYAFLLNIGLPVLLRNLTAYFMGVDLYSTLRFSDEFIWNFMIGGLFTLHLKYLFHFMLIRDASNTTAVAFSDKIRWLAGASFSIYVMHYPLMQFLSAVLPNFSPTEALDYSLLLVLSIAGCFVFAELFERNLATFRDCCRTISGRLSV